MIPVNGVCEAIFGMQDVLNTLLDKCRLLAGNVIWGGDSLCCASWGDVRQFEIKTYER